MFRTKVTDIYTEYVAEVTDAPALYGQWLAYFVLSCVVNRSVWMDYGGFMKIHPNLYLLIVGPSSVYRKSFSQDLAMSFVREVHPDFKLIDVSSRGAFISELSRKDRSVPGAAAIVIDELAGFMSRVKTSPHFAGMIQDLSTAFTGSTIERRVGINEDKKEVYRIEEPFLNLTAACSYDWLTQSIETSDLTGGFLARFLWIIATEKKGEHWSEAKSGDRLKREMILSRLREIKDMIGPMRWTTEARALWDLWYSAFREKNQGGRWDANFERMTNQVRKIAMLNAVQQLRFDITEEDLQDAILISEPLVDHLNDVAIGDNPEEILRQRIVQLMKRRTLPVSRSELLNGINGIDKRRLDAGLETLVEADRVETVPFESTHKGRPPTLYRLCGKVKLSLNAE